MMDEACQTARTHMMDAMFSVKGQTQNRDAFIWHFDPRVNQEISASVCAEMPLNANGAEIMAES